MKNFKFIFMIAFTALFISCASIPPPELVSARQAYKQASTGTAAQLVPAEVHKAHVALEAAEKSFIDQPKSYRTRDLAYIADRKAKMAEAFAVTATENAATEKANKDYQASQAQIVKNTKEDLAASQASAIKKNQDLALADEKQARLLAENKVIDAKAEAERVKDSSNAEAKRVMASSAAETQRVKELSDAEALRVKTSTDAEARRVKELSDAEARRLADIKAKESTTIVVLEKGKKVVLKGINFETNKAVLTPDSWSILGSAYNAMIANPDVQIEISGHTDNVGSQEYNQTLSLERAQAVRTWLINKGIVSTRMKTSGKGENEPVVSNDTKTGRAENRRIEFYVQQ